MENAWGTTRNARAAKDARADFVSASASDAKQLSASSNTANKAAPVNAWVRQSRSTTAPSWMNTVGYDASPNPLETAVAMKAGVIIAAAAMQDARKLAAA